MASRRWRPRSRPRWPTGSSSSSRLATAMSPFPGMMREVISAGGVFVAEDGLMLASDYASAFDSRIYPGRHVPDFCGLVGEAANRAAYIMLPVPPGRELDRLTDGTAGEGWGVFSGTSAAAPQLAGVCALLLRRIRASPPLTSRHDAWRGRGDPVRRVRPAGAAPGAGRVRARARLHPGVLHRPAPDAVRADRGDVQVLQCLRAAGGAVLPARGEPDELGRHHRPAGEALAAVGRATCRAGSATST